MPYKDPVISRIKANERSRAYRARQLAKDPEFFRRRDRRLSAAKLAAMSPEDREAYRVKRLAQHRARYHANPEKARAQARRSYARNPDNAKANRNRRKARLRAIPVNDYSAAQWREQQAVQNHRCYYCGKRRKGKLTQDHIVPLSQGGNHTASNIIAACNACNLSKRAKAPPIPVQMNLLMLAPPQKKRKAS
jgi:5-methylcytosine-specific restriction endonuclease McrA